MGRERGLAEKKPCRKETKQRTMAGFREGGSERRHAVKAKHSENPPCANSMIVIPNDHTSLFTE
jgi:hypothetical protein